MRNDPTSVVAGYFGLERQARERAQLRIDDHLAVLGMSYRWASDRAGDFGGALFGEHVDLMRGVYVGGVALRAPRRSISGVFCLLWGVFERVDA